MDLEHWLEEVARRIPPLDRGAMAQARARQDTLTKPRGSLGRLEDLSVHLAGIQGDPLPRLERKAVVVMAGDHGVVEEGVSAYPQEVTAQMVRNFLAGGAGVNVLARQAGARVVVVDLGVASDLEPQPGLVVRKVAHGTANLARGPAMDRAEALRAIRAGFEVVEDLAREGLDALALGEMGIGNTTPATALACAFTGRPPAELAGRGTGLDDAGLARKVAVLQRALALHRPSPHDPLDALARLGGLEIAGLVGAVLAGALHRVPLFVDGLISTAGAMVAVALAPEARSYLIAGHRSPEPAHEAMLAWLGLRPLLDLGMRLGEGTGAVLAMMLAESACRLLGEMATFRSAGVSDREG